MLFYISKTLITMEALNNGHLESFIFCHARDHRIEKFQSIVLSSIGSHSALTNSLIKNYSVQITCLDIFYYLFQAAQ